jgi:Holliday junction resolvase RusA-like endonuclease
MVLFSCKVPVKKHAIKKNSKQIAFNKGTGKRFIRSNDDAIFYEKWLVHKLIAEKLKQRIDTITKPISVKFIFWFPMTVYFTKKGQRNKKIADMSNLYQSPEDALQKAGIIFDDNLIENHDGSKRKPIDDTSYWLEIVISDCSD